MAFLTLSDVINNLKSNTRTSTTPLTKKIKDELDVIGNYSFKRKGVYTVLTTLLYYKYLNPSQDIRYFQSSMNGGFSGRSFDTANVTPVLKSEGLPAMAESGWLTRSLEQPYPYDKKYNGKIPKVLKDPFLDLLDYVQQNPNYALAMLEELLSVVIHLTKANTITIQNVTNPDTITIDKVKDALFEHFTTNYGTHGGAKLPVLAFHSIYTILLDEMKRFENCSLSDLSSLTACDRTNKASGDVEIFEEDELFEAIEIKLDKPIDLQIVQVVREKIYKFAPKRYYILSVDGIKEDDRDKIENIVAEVEKKNGCQLIINGLIPSLKYYLRLISNTSDFVRIYSSEVERDKELQIEHKKKWNELMSKYGF